MRCPGFFVGDGFDTSVLFIILEKGGIFFDKLFYIRRSFGDICALRNGLFFLFGGWCFGFFFIFKNNRTAFHFGFYSREKNDRSHCNRKFSDTSACNKCKNNNGGNDECDDIRVFWFSVLHCKSPYRYTSYNIYACGTQKIVTNCNFFRLLCNCFVTIL